MTFEAIVGSERTQGRSQLGSFGGALGAAARRVLLPLGLSLLLAPAALADSAAMDGPPPSEDPAYTAPPGTLGPEGMVPAEGASGTAAQPEQIGHVPGPDEGVYGDPPNSGSGNPADRGWAYDDRYFFALTKGLETDTDLGPTARRWVSPLTLTFDVLTLPTAALAGLSGREPETEPASDPAAAPAQTASQPTS